MFSAGSPKQKKRKRVALKDYLHLLAPGNKAYSLQQIEDDCAIGARPMREGTASPASRAPGGLRRKRPARQRQR